MAQNSQPNFWIFLCPQKDLQRNHLVKPEDEGKHSPYNQCRGSPESLTMNMQEWPPTATRLLCNWCLFGREAGGHLTDLRTRELQNTQWVLTAQSQGVGEAPQSKNRGVHREQSEDWRGRGTPSSKQRQSTLIPSPALPKARDLSLVKPLDSVADMQEHRRICWITLYIFNWENPNGARI